MQAHPLVRAVLVAGALAASTALAACASSASPGTAAEPQPTTPTTPTAAAPASAALTPLAPDDLRSAPVPEACGHPAGVLVDGFLPGIGAEDGFVGLGAAVAERYRTGAAQPLVAINPAPAAGDVGAVAVVTCTRGGVPWPDLLVAYSPDLEIMAAYDTGELSLGPNDTLGALSWDGENTVSFDWSVLRADEPSGGSRLVSRETLTIADGRESLTLPDIVDARALADRFLAAVDQRDWAAVESLSGPAVAERLRSAPGPYYVRFAAEDVLACVDAEHPAIMDYYRQELSTHDAAFMCEYVHAGGSLAQGRGTIAIVPLIGAASDGSLTVTGVLVPNEV